jgi:hypothetical protein
MRSEASRTSPWPTSPVAGSPCGSPERRRHPGPSSIASKQTARAEFSFQISPLERTSRVPISCSGHGARTYLIEWPSLIQADDFHKSAVLGLTSASLESRTTEIIVARPRSMSRQCNSRQQVEVGWFPQNGLTFTTTSSASRYLRNLGTVQ